MIAIFSQKTSCLEILLADEAVSDASELLAQYSPQETAEGLVIYPVGDPAGAFLYGEVSDLLKAGGIGEVVMYDKHTVTPVGAASAVAVDLLP